MKRRFLALVLSRKVRPLLTAGYALYILPGAVWRGIRAIPAFTRLAGKTYWTDGRLN